MLSSTVYIEISSFRCDHFDATYFVVGHFLRRSFQHQFGALRQFGYLGLGLRFGLVKKQRTLGPKRSALKWSRRKVVQSYILYLQYNKQWYQIVH